MDPSSDPNRQLKRMITMLAAVRPWSGLKLGLCAQGRLCGEALIVALRLY